MKMGGLGLGPCYVDKYSRKGVRISDLFHPDVFRKKLEWNISEKGFLLKNFYGIDYKYDIEKIMEEYLSYASSIRKYLINNISSFLNDSIESGKKILMEGAQGTMLDVDHGTYPYVTSSNPVSGGACTGAGISPRSIDKVLGVVKAYVTRVGDGPFPTEIDGGIGEKLREIGGEYGATTGRPRRCGWFDGVVMKHSARVNGLTSLVVTKLDVLSNFEKIKICTAYQKNGAIVSDFPSSIEDLAGCEPVYEEVDGWNEDISSVRSAKELPAKAQSYIKKLAEIAKTEISMVSVGPERSQIIKL